MWSPAPKSLFWRMAWLLLAAVALAVVAIVLLFRQDRAGLIARNLTEAKIAQVEALRDALNARLAEGPAARPLTGLSAIARQYGVLLVPVERRPEIGQPPRGQGLRALVEKLQEQLGRDTEVRLGMRMDQPVVWIRLRIGSEPNVRAVWAGIPIRRMDADEVPLRLWMALAGVLALLLAATYAFARKLTTPLAELADAVDMVAEGKRPDPLPEDGPEEISRVARNVNRMAVNLDRLERDRSTMLAGISHDIRTPLTRLRLASELAVADARSREEMAADIDEIDRIVTQFLDFARGVPEAPPPIVDLTAVAEEVAARAATRDLPVQWQRPPGVLCAAVHAAAFERMLLNLIENAHRYGRPPVILQMDGRGDTVVIEVLDSGSGIAASDVERLKQPFVRGDHARGGVMGAGLGLAIVERLAQCYQGRFELLPRTVGGTTARISLPMAHADVSRGGAAVQPNSGSVA